jgi:hypothetical protein
VFSFGKWLRHLEGRLLQVRTRDDVITIATAKALGQWVSDNPVKAYLAYEILRDFLPKHIHGLYSAAKKAE